MKFLTFFGLLALAFAAVRVVTLEEIEEISEPKVIIFGNSEDTATNDLVGTLEPIVAGFEDAVELLLVDKSVQENPVFEGFEKLPVVFTQMPGETNPTPLTAEDVVEGVNAAYELSQVEADYSLVDKFVSAEDIVKTWSEDGRPVVVKHYEEWCGHCQALKPHFAKAAARVPNARFLEVECSASDEAKKFCSEQLVRGYPTIKIFHGEWIPYEGERVTGALAEFVGNVVKSEPATWDGKCLTVSDYLELEDDDFENPIALSDRFVEMSMAKLETDTNSKVVVFGDIREEVTQEFYLMLEKVLDRVEKIWTFPVVHVEKRHAKNADIFSYPAFEKLPVVFFVSPESPNPAFYDGELTAEALEQHIVELMEEPDFSAVEKFESLEQIANFAKEGKSVFVKHYEEWCAHCKALKPKFAKAALKAENAVFLDVECSASDVSQKFCNDNGVKGFPTLRLWNGEEWISYEGPRAVNAMVSFAKEHPAVANAGDITFETAEDEIYEPEDVSEEDDVVPSKVAPVSDNVVDKVKTMAAEISKIVVTKSAAAASKAGAIVGMLKEKVTKLVQGEGGDL